jgi:hypothetical protein
MKFLFLPIFVTHFRLLDSWQPSYSPDYCSADIPSRAVPTLTPAEAAEVESLKQVQAVIRHGSRTPWGKFPCWESYDLKWSCNVTTEILPSIRSSGDERSEPWIFRKVYDASPNDLGGTCLLGQLIEAGYVQEQQLGTLLRNKYIGADNATEGDFKVYKSPVFDSLGTSESSMYLRSTDVPRTLMSGQVLLSSLFDVTSDVTVEWHTGDKDLDQLTPNAKACPALTGIESKAQASQDFMAQNMSATTTKLTSDLNTIYTQGDWGWDYTLDCAYTTVCNNYEMPAGTEDVPMTDALFNQSMLHATWLYTYPLQYNNSEYARLGMSNTTYTLRTFAEKAVAAKGDDYDKFVLLSGHDTTVIPLLAALLPPTYVIDWAPYASYVTFELYEGKSDSDFWARVVYNAKPLTRDIVGLDTTDCVGDLCPWNALRAALLYATASPDACFNADAVAPEPGPSPSPGSLTSDGCTGIAKSPATFVLVVVASLLFGALLCFLIITSKTVGYHRIDQETSSLHKIETKDADDGRSPLHQQLPY